jgi:TniB protein
MGVSGDYPHLHPSVRPLADEASESRIRRIRTDRWIAYARAEAALSAIEDLLSFPQRTRMPNMLLVGPTNNGKTMIVESCCEHSNVESGDILSNAEAVSCTSSQH